MARLTIRRSKAVEVRPKTLDISEKVKRDAFLYFDPHANSPEDEFAQCDTCRMFVPGESAGSKHDLCIIHGSGVEVGEEYSCGLYVIWPKGKPSAEVVKNHAEELKAGIPGSVTPKESGLVERQVRCENCAFFKSKSTTCGLYETLNKTLPALFDLDTSVNEDGCCNANTAYKQEGQ